MTKAIDLREQAAPDDPAFSDDSDVEVVALPDRQDCPIVVAQLLKEDRHHKFVYAREREDQSLLISFQRKDGFEKCAVDKRGFWIFFRAPSAEELELKIDRMSLEDFPGEDLDEGLRYAYRQYVLVRCANDPFAEAERQSYGCGPEVRDLLMEDAAQSLIDRKRLIKRTVKRPPMQVSHRQSATGALH